MEPRLERQLSRVSDRMMRVRRERASAATWTLFAVLGFAALPGFAALTGRADLGWSGAAALAALAAAAVLAVRRRVARAAPDARAAARLLERERPELDSALLAAAELEPDLDRGGYGYLATRLLGEVLSDARARDWPAVVPRSRLRVARAAHVAGGGLFLAAAATLWGSAAGGSRPAGSGPVARAAAVSVLPGDAEVEKGHGVLVTAEFGVRDVPAEAFLVHRAPGGEPQRLALARSLDDPLFGARLAALENDLDYHVEWNGGASPSFRLTVFEHPELVRADVLVDYPEYTALEDRRLEDTRRVTAPEGSRLTLICRFNKAVSSAEWIEEGSAAELTLLPHETDPLEYRATFELTRSRRLSLALVDAAGRRNQERTELVFKVTSNERPHLRLGSARDARVSPIEELALCADVADDYGLLRFGVGYRLGGGPPTEVVLGAGADAHKLEAAHTLQLEELAAEPDELVAYHFWAEDLGVDGAARRTTSDLFFAEVRPFEEIFREAEPPPGGREQAEEPGAGEPPGGGAAQQAGELAELQRDIVLATWKAIQRAADGTDTLGEDVRVVRDAQQSVEDRLGELTPMVTSDAGEMGPGMVDVAEPVERALRELDRALAEGSPDPLHEALSAEQAAYQALLRMRAREFDVARAQSQSGSRSSRAGAQSGPSQAQLQQLELSDSENRYETQREARTPAEAARETRQALSRLKELARRQADLNERLRELQAELQAARSAEEEREARRRLERLQKAQEQILRDTDELRQRLDESAQRERFAEQREQLERTRENVRRASEALEEGRLAQALAEGARARRELDELEEDLRTAAGEEFDERMREMQREARRLEEEQERIATELGADEPVPGRAEAAPGERPSLRSPVEGTEPASPERSGRAGRAALGRALEQQEADLADLLEEAEETVRAAEDSEPLLAEDLFDALSEARRGQLAEALEMTRRLVEEGFPRQAEEAERVARARLGDLRRGIEDAAENVLGSGVDALERAEQELERLSAELESELARARSGEELTPGDEPSRSGADPRDTPPPPGAGAPPEPGAATARAPGEPAGEQTGEQPGEQPGAGRGDPRAAGERAPRRSLGGDEPRPRESGGGRGPGGGRVDPVAPLSGDDFRDWSDRLRDVEEMIDDPELSAEAARIRGRARAAREEVKRHSREPDWELVDEKIARPLGELGREVAEELRRRRAEDGLVPIDRDPVPPEFSEDVRRYYERLGRGR